jgi:hypothetical protein
MAHLRRIGLAILDYHRQYGYFPKPYTVTSDGTLLHSWRSLILPFLDCDAVFENINFEQPWDSEANRVLWSHSPEVYRSENCLAFQTKCVAIVNKNTIWPPNGLRTMRDISSGTSYTVAVVQSERTSVNWMQPADIDLESAVAEYASLHSVLAVFVDGHVDTIRDIDSERFRELICI